MPDPLDYTLVRIDDNIADKAVLTYDAANDKLTDSGLKASKGEIKANAGTVSVGLQDISSAGEQTIWTNRASSINYAPPWHIIDEVNPGGSKDRFYGPIQTVTRFAIKTDVLENPSFAVHIPVHQVVFRLVMDFPEANDNVQFIVTSTGNLDERIWDEFGIVSAGTNTIVLDKPIAYHPGDYIFTIKPYGDVNLEPPVKVMGEAQTGKVGYDVHFREFTDKPIATEEYVVAAITGGPADDIMLKAAYDGDNDGSVNLADAVKGVVGSGNDKYYGTDVSGAVGFHDLPAGADDSDIRALIATNKQAITGNKATIDGNKTALNAHGVQIAAHAQKIATNTTNIANNSTKASQNAEAIVTMRKNAITGMSAEKDDTHKTLTIKLTSVNGVVDTAQFDLSSWFSGSTTPGTDYKIYYGFVTNPPLAEAEILRLSTEKTVPTVAGLDIIMTRSESSSRYMWVWLPDSAGSIKGFTFGGFLSTWASEDVSVSGVAGKFYTSPNQTVSQNVQFEVTQ